jgi:septum formation protein
VGGPLWRGDAPLLLASTSATKQALLRAVGIEPDVEAPGVDERAVEAAVGGSDPAALAARLAEAKALAVSARRPGRVVVGADQTLACEGRLFHKPADEEAARSQIAALSGRFHALHSAAAIARKGVLLRSVGAEARLLMRPLDAAAIARYVALAGPGATASVGGYQVEGLGMHLFERIEGDHATILGLPLLPLLAAFRDLDLLSL